MFSSNDVYLTGLVLDPCYCGMDLGMKDLNPLVIKAIKVGGGASPEKKLPELIKRASDFLLEMLRKEYVIQKQAVAGLEAREALTCLKDQIVHFVKNAYPFDRELAPGDGPQEWWQALSVDQTPLNQAQPLAVSLHFF